MSKTKPFTDKCNWKDIDFPPHGNDWRKCESNNKSIDLNCYNTETCI